MRAENAEKFPTQSFANTFKREIISIKFCLDYFSDKGKEAIKIRILKKM